MLIITILQSESVDDQHAVLNYDTARNFFRIKDLGTSHGVRINFKSLLNQI